MPSNSQKRNHEWHIRYLDAQMASTCQVCHPYQRQPVAFTPTGVAPTLPPPTLTEAVFASPVLGPIAGLGLFITVGVAILGSIAIAMYLLVTNLTLVLLVFTVLFLVLLVFVAVRGTADDLPPYRAFR